LGEVRAARGLRGVRAATPTRGLLMRNTGEAAG